VEIEFLVTDLDSGTSGRFSTALMERLLLGRDASSPIPFRGPKISREHFELLIRDSRVLLRDLSTNGTWVNGERAARGSEREIRSGNLVEIPGYRVQVRLPDQTPRSTPSRLEPSEVDQLPPRSSLLGPAYAFISSFGLLESFVLLGGIGSLSIVLLYLTLLK
jgi:pSer/pThr/pTyr-binding forkhead associated (FHA) protein